MIKGKKWDVRDNFLCFMETCPPVKVVHGWLYRDGAL